MCLACHGPTGVKPVLALRTREGHALRLTADHPVRRVWQAEGNRAATEWVKAGELQPGDRVALNDHRAFARWEGAYGSAEGYLLGLLLGDGTFREDEALLAAWDPGMRRVANGGSVLSADPQAVSRVFVTTAMAGREAIKASAKAKYETGGGDSEEDLKKRGKKRSARATTAEDGKASTARPARASGPPAASISCSARTRSCVRWRKSTRAGMGRRSS